MRHANTYKTLIILAVFTFFGSVANAQSKYLKEMRDKLSDHEGVKSLSLSGNLLGMMAIFDSNDDEALNEFISKVNSFNLLIIDETQEDIKELVKTKRLIKRLDNEGFSEYTSVKDKDQLLDILVKERRGYVKGLVFVLAESKSNALVLEIVCDVKRKYLKKILQSFKCNDSHINFDI